MKNGALFVPDPVYSVLHMICSTPVDSTNHQQKITDDGVGMSTCYSPGQGAQLVRTSSGHTEVAGSCPGQDAEKNRTNESTNKWNNESISLSLKISNFLKLS